MKKTVILCLAILLPLMEIAASPQDEANAILKVFVGIEKSRNELTIKNKTLNDGTTLSFWSQKTRLKKLVVYTKDDFGKTEDHYYFKRGSLILCRTIHEYYPLDAKGEQSAELKTDKRFLLYKESELIKPNAAASDASYIELGIEKRNALINYLSQASL